MTSSLVPPNSDALSDVVIGDVMQRSRRPTTQSNVEPHQPQSFLRLTYREPSDLIAEALSTKERSLMMKTLAGRKPLPPRGEDVQVYSRKRKYESSSRRQTGESTAHSKPKTRRERCRINQARYRTKQRLYATGLEEGIKKVNHEIYDLEVHRNIILRSTPTNETVWNVATEYFHLFRHGYTMPVMGTESLLGHSTGLTKDHGQLDFLQKKMVEDVTDGTLCGAEEMLENWKLISLYHKDICLELRRLESGPGKSLVAMTKLSFTITENTLRHVYPHLAVDEDAHSDHVKWSSVGKRLLNQRLELPGVVIFDWDDDSGRVARLETRVDMTTPLLKVLGSLEDVARAMDGAFMTHECKLIMKAT